MVVDVWAHACSKVLKRSTVWVCAPLILVAAVVASPVAAAAVPPALGPLRLPAAATAPDEKSAMKLAEESGARVEVMADRTEYEQLFAEPDGRLTYETTAVPQRVERSDGSWADVDLSLEHAADGTVRPRASVADVRFSADGKGPLVTLVDGRKTLTLSWPGGPLHAPKLAGTTATYAEVMPGVDLIVRPTELGFSHVLAVKSAAAATNTELRKITFELGGDAKVSRLRDGSLQAVVGRAVLASAPAPAMWDSRTAVTTAKSSAKAAAAVQGAAGDPSTAGAPGDTARTAPVQTEVTASGDLVLRPDEALLGGNATFPVFIDPAWSKGKNRWAYSTNNNTNNSDVSRARVGKDPDGRIYRSYFEFSTSTLKSKHIESAYVQMTLDHTWSCDNTWTHMYSSNPISATPRTAWKSSKPFLQHLSAAESHANEGSGCSDSPQPDMTVNFTGGNVTTLLSGVASKGASTVTIAFSAGNETQGYESATDRWKKFFPGDAKLIADIDAKPGVPNSLQVNGIACRSTTISIGLTNPYFSAVMPDADVSQAIKSTWEWYEVSGTTLVKKTSPVTTTTMANTRDMSNRVAGAVDGRTYAFRVMGTDSAPYSINSSFSAYCYFKVDTSDPAVSATMLSTPAGPGQEGTVRISSPATDVTKFRYGWNEAVLTEAAAGTIAGVTGKAVDVTVTAPRYGENVLYLQAIDGTLNEGDGSLTFTVDRPSPPIARWGLETYPGTEAGSELTDAQPALPVNPAPFQQADASLETPVAVTWTDKQRLIGGQNATFSGNGSMTTATGVVDTTKSFAVAAWVRVDDTSGYRTIVSQDGDQVANFQLQYRPDDRNSDGVADKSFCITTRVSDATEAASTVVCGINTAVAGRWTHVAGVYDAAEKKLRLWVNGVQKAEANATAAWAGTGKLRIGNRKQSSSVWTDYLVGGVADVQVFDRALVQHDFTGQRAAEPGSGGVNEPGILQPVEVGRWDFETAVPCYDPSIADTCSAPDGAAWSRDVRLTQGAEISSGSRGSYLGLDTRQLLYDDPADPFYGIATREYGVTQKNAADVPVLRTDQSFTVSAWVHVDSVTTSMTALAPKGTKQSAFYLGTRQSTVDGVTAQRFEVMTSTIDSDLGETWVHTIAPRALDIDDEGSFAHLAVVYDAGTKQMRLYVNGALQDTDTWASAWQANGPLIVGGAWYSSDNAAGRFTDPWYGGVDDVQTYQGALTSAQIETLYDEQTA
ncbi:LamG domain-containing protein [Actinoplanes sp. NPDC049599]|uniref:LamG domain-containing protein n=1 Tax=Actinoplanes sp. NPDC049599 TaxID=3363903 RepID=UPI0037913655